MSRLESVLRSLPSTGTVAVVGDDELARELRHRLGAVHPVSDQPDAIVDTTGDLDSMAGSIRRVAVDGTIVLAGPEPEQPLLINLYADLHSRCLTVVGVPHGS